MIFISIFCLGAMGCAGPVTRAPVGNSAAVAREAQLQREMVYRGYVQDRDRIFNIAYPILSANEDYCGKRTAPQIGMSAWNLDTVGASYRQAAQSLYNLQDRLAVQFVADLGPAAQAGIRSGDFIVSINGQAIPPGPRALDVAAKAYARTGYGPVQIVTERQGQTQSYQLRPVRGCDIPVLLDYDSNDINAFTDGEKIVVSKGIVRFAQNDNEIALVVAHELAHAAIDHVGKMQQNAMIGTLGGFAVDSLLAAAGINSGAQFTRAGGQMGATRHAIAFEQEADYIGMYFMERAGYSAAGVAHFWRRMATENPQSISVRSTHPTAPERFVAIENTHREITDKKKRGLALAPNFNR